MTWLALTAACDGGGSGALARSGLAANRRVASLADGELQRLCEWSNGLSDVDLDDEALCTYNALLSNSAAECEREVEACLARAGAGMMPGLLGVRRQDCARRTAAAVPADCKATVEALERCQRDLIDAMVQDAMRATCDDIGVLWTPVPSSCPAHVLVCTRLLSDRP